MHDESIPSFSISMRELYLPEDASGQHSSAQDEGTRLTMCGGRRVQERQVILRLPCFPTMSELSRSVSPWATRTALSHKRTAPAANTFSRPLASTVRGPVQPGRRWYSCAIICSPVPEHQPNAPLVSSLQHMFVLPLKAVVQFPELHVLLQVRCRQGRGLCPVQAVQAGVQLSLPECVITFALFQPV
jgi:hypothetical protein